MGKDKREERGGRECIDGVHVQSANKAEAGNRMEGKWSGGFELWI